jgi:hypothetical protein
MSSRTRSNDVMRGFASMFFWGEITNVSSFLEEALKISDLAHLEIHGPEEELAKLREPRADLNPQFFTLEYGFRR